MIFNKSDVDFRLKTELKELANVIEAIHVNLIESLQFGQR